MSQLLIAGNWKMNCGPTEAKVLAEGLKKIRGGRASSNQVLVSPPYISIPTVVNTLKGTGILTAAQNVHTEDSGAYTGEISSPMIKNAGCTHVIAGHSERREYFQEDDELVAKKARKVLDEGLSVIVCVGEQLGQRKNNEQEKVVKRQLDVVLNQVEKKDAQKFIIAYEPVWAIGTGETATPQQAQEMHRVIRNILKERWDENSSKQVKILYGGSMKPANAEELLSQEDVDGGLIGGASLKAESFSEIIGIAESISSNG